MENSDINYSDVEYSEINYSMDNQQVINKWNWGAFALSIPWAIGNKTYLGLLTLIPFFGFIWMFICGVKGNAWAWQSNEYRDIEEFRRVQETWNRAGLVYFIISIVFILLYVLFLGAIFAAIFSSAYYY